MSDPIIPSRSCERAQAQRAKEAGHSRRRTIAALPPVDGRGGLPELGSKSEVWAHEVI